MAGSGRNTACTSPIAREGAADSAIVHRSIIANRTVRTTHGTGVRAGCVRDDDTRIGRSVNGGIDTRVDRSVNGGIDTRVDRSVNGGIDIRVDRSVNGGIDTRVDRSVNGGIDTRVGRSVNGGIDTRVGRSVNGGIDTRVGCSVCCAIDTRVTSVGAGFRSAVHHATDDRERERSRGHAAIIVTDRDGERKGHTSGA
jgi:hypothetical protein